MKLKLTFLTFLVLSIFELRAQSLNIPLLTVTEKEVAYTEVDEIHFRIVINTHAKEVMEARAQNRKIAESVFGYLESKKIPKQYIQTKRMRITRNYINKRPPVKYDGFYAYQVIYVCLKDIHLYDEIIDKVLAMEIESISGPDFKSSKYEEVQKKARLAALKKARKTATEMAEALGQKIGKAKLINTDFSRNRSNSAYPSQPASNTNQSAGSSFEVGEIEIAASVVVSFELLD